MRIAPLLLAAPLLLLAESVAGLKWTAPAGWVSKGSAPMRAATYNAGGSECVVYFFGAGQGGSVEANLARWKGQVTVNGHPAPAKTAKKIVRGLSVTTLDTSGTYEGASGMPMAPDAPKGARMLAAIIESPGGNIFIKYAGPAKTIAENAAKFDALVASFQPEK